MVAPLVSVLLPVYNAATTIGDALGSLVQQTLVDFEVIAVDDGSTDGTHDVLAAWARADARIRVVPLAHVGLVAALNQGLARCRAPLVARMDADDLCHPERLGAQAELLAREPSTDVAGCLVDAFPAGQVGTGMELYLDWLNELVSHEQICRELFIESPIVHPSAMVRRHRLVAAGGYQDQDWPEDYDLWLRLHAVGSRFAKVPRILLHWREHPQRLTRTDRRYAVEGFLRAKAHFLCAGPLRTRDDVVIWGAGRTGRRLSKQLERRGRPPRLFVDIAPGRVGNSLRRRPVIAPAGLPRAWADLVRPVLLVAVASRGARTLIRAALAEMGLIEGRDYLCAA